MGFEEEEEKGKGRGKGRGKGKGKREKGPKNQRSRLVHKLVIVCIAADFCASLSQIWIPEIEYYQKLSSHAQIGAQGAEKQQSKV